MSKELTTGELKAILRSHYEGDGWAFLEEVPNGTSDHKTRSADALAMGLWKTKGIHLTGFELKVSRSDWLKEMQDESKSEAFARYCDYWYLVSPEKVAKLEELPAHWGWLVPTPAGKLRKKKMATRNPSPQPIDRPFLAGLCRSLHRRAPGKDELDAARRAGYRDGLEEGRKQGSTRDRHKAELDARILEQMQKSIDEFERASGIKITAYTGKQMGEAVRLVQHFTLDYLTQQIGRIAREAQHSAERWQACLAELQQAMKIPDNPPPGDA